MVTLIANPLRNWHLLTIRKWTIGGEKSANKSGWTPNWMMKDSSRFGEFWSGSKTSLLGTRENSAVVP
jgi:hypothetical protein